jgi:tetratricopeptide (TPR) repeat protein
LGAFGEAADQIAVPGPSPEIPGSLRDLLAARLDGLSPSARDTAQLAAVLGREFRYELLSAVARKEEPTLRADVNELVQSGLVYHRRTVRPESYVFKHGLVCDAAYETMVKSRRQRVHQRVANTLRQRFPDIEQHRPEILALHFEKGGEILSAARYWHRAGDLALQRAAHVEALHQLQRGLRLVETTPPFPERIPLEIDLLTTLGTALFMTKGYAAEEVERTYAQAWGLCEQLGEDIPLKVLYGIWGVRLTRSDRAGVEELTPRLQQLARKDDRLYAIMAEAALGPKAFWEGNFLEAHQHLTRGIELYGTDAFERFTREIGYDPGLYSHAYEMLVLWHLGHADRAEALRQQLLAIAERSRNPYSVSLALGFGVDLSCSRGDTESVLEMSQRLLALATEQHLYLWLAPAMCNRGAALAQRGDTGEAITTIQQGLDIYRRIGVLVSYSYYLSHLGAAYLAAGRVTEASATVDEGLSLCHSLLARCHEPELWRLKGELLALQKDAEGAEGSLCRALEVARRQHATALELRAATSLSRLLRGQGKPEAARTLLTGVYGQFTEGFDTRDLRLAKALLAELS